MITTAEFYFIHRKFIRFDQELKKSKDAVIKSIDLIQAVKTSFRVESKIMSAIYGVSPATDQEYQSQDSMTELLKD